MTTCGWFHFHSGFQTKMIRKMVYRLFAKTIEQLSVQNFDLLSGFSIALWYPWKFFFESGSVIALDHIEELFCIVKFNVSKNIENKAHDSYHACVDTIWSILIALVRPLRPIHLKALALVYFDFKLFKFNRCRVGQASNWRDLYFLFMLFLLSKWNCLHTVI